jgi:anti-anti-sigma regulatory factor
MTRKNNELSMEIYHRIYRLTKKNVDPQQIAVTLSLPFKTVQNVVERIQAGLEAKAAGRLQKAAAKAEAKDQEPYLDIYTLPRGRYAVLDINGDLIEEHVPALERELKGMLKAQWKSIALLMKSVRSMDESALHAVLTFRDEYLRHGRYTAVLDPSSAVDHLLTGTEEAVRLDVFGTEKTFEERAFATTREIELRNKKSKA